MMHYVPPPIVTPPDCETFSCGPLVAPSVQVIYASPNAVRHDAEFRAIVEGGYLDPLAPAAPLLEPLTLPLPAGTLSNASIRQTVSAMPRGTVYLIVLGPEQLPEPHSGGIYAYHDESDDGRFGVIPAAWDGQVRMDAAHELVEAIADAEIADPCGYVWTQYAGMTLQTYSIGGQCTAGIYSRAQE